MGIFGPKTPFSNLCKGEGKRGFLDPRNPLFQEMGIRAPVWDRGNPNTGSENRLFVAKSFLIYLTMSKVGVSFGNCHCSYFRKIDGAGTTPIPIK